MTQYNSAATREVPTIVPLASEPVTDDHTVIVLGTIADVLWACWREPGERREDWFERAGQMAVAFVEAQS